jgi:hypothetical protein
MLPESEQNRRAILASLTFQSVFPEQDQHGSGAQSERVTSSNK